MHSRSYGNFEELVWVLLSDRVLANFVLDDEGKICIAVAMEILSEEVQEKIGRTEIEMLNLHELYLKEVQEKIGRT